MLSERESESVVNADTLEIGMVVACYLSCYTNEEPQIGQVLSLSDNSESVVIEWMTGTYSEPWTLIKYRHNGAYTTWKETIPITAIT